LEDQMNGNEEQWKKRKGFDPETREKMIMDHLMLVKYIAKRLANHLPACIDLEDLIEVGIIGLIDAIEKYDPTKNIKFKTYAEFRIRGAILDELRSLDCTPRSIHQKAKQFESAYQDAEKKVGKEATSAEIAQEMGLSVEEFNQLSQQTKGFSVLNIEDIEKGLSKKEKENLIGMLKYSYDEHVLEYLNYKKIRDVLSEAIEGLPARQKTVLSLYYWNEMSMREVGELLGLAESTVSSHHHRGIKHLRQRVKELSNRLDLCQ
jgi:RNA polymerase sigma factor for flagellar operon FliA